MKKPLVDGFSTKITRVRQELCVLVYPSSMDLSSRTLWFLTGQLTAKRQQFGTRWRRLPAFDEVPELADVAHRLGLSPRTLQRRLREEDTSWRAELEEVAGCGWTGCCAIR